MPDFISAGLNCTQAHTHTHTLLAAFPLSCGCLAVMRPKTSVSIWFCREGGSVLASPGGAIWLPLGLSKEPQNLDWEFWHQENAMMGPSMGCMRCHRRWWPLLPPPRWRVLFLGVQKTALKWVPKLDLASAALEKCVLFPDGSRHVKSITNYNPSEGSTTPVKAYFRAWGSHTEFISVFSSVFSTRSQLIQLFFI